METDMNDILDDLRDVESRAQQFMIIELGPETLKAIQELTRAIVSARSGVAWWSGKLVTPASAAPSSQSAAPPPRDPSPRAETHASPPREQSWRTAERRAALQAGYLAGRSLQDLRADLMALPGPPVPENVSLVGSWATKIGLKRPYAGWATPKRLDLLRREYAAGTDVAAIRAAMMALPGPAMPLNADIKHQVGKIGVKRPDWFHAELGRRGAASVHQRPAPPAKQASSTPLVTVKPRPPAPPPQPLNAMVAPKLVPRDAVAQSMAVGEASTSRGATWTRIAEWCAARGMRFDGDMLPVNAARRAAGLAEWVCIEPFGPGSGPAG